MKIKKIKLLIAVALILTTFFASFSIANADDLSKFHVNAIIPKNQIDKKLSYYDLKMNAKETQDITFQIFNYSDEEETFEISLPFATTNINGLIIYTETDLTLADETLKHPFTKVASLEKNKDIIDNKLIMPAQSSKDVIITITMPEDTYDGIILGGIRVLKLPKESEESEVQGASFVNQFAYVVGIKLTETSNEVIPELKLNYVKPVLVDNRSSVAINIQNPKPIIMSSVNLKADIYKKNSTTVLKTQTIESFSFAPNCNVDFRVPWGSSKISPGTYDVKITATLGDDSWNWDENFTINSEEANFINKGVVELKEDYSLIFIIIGIFFAALLIIIIILIFILLKKKKKKEDSEIIAETSKAQDAQNKDNDI